MVIEDFKIIPYVRMTGKGKWRDRAKRYLKNQMDLSWLIRLNGRGMGWESGLSDCIFVSV